MIARRIYVSGVVQGVGFRPFVYRIASANNLGGYVKNLGDAGVEIFIEGKEEDVENFLHKLRFSAPPLARVEDVKIENTTPLRMEHFEILESSTERKGGDSIIPPDVAICEDCLRELFNPEDRRYMYPFIVCTNCGPRFSIIESLPYDRKNTAMRDFPMCNICEEEYTNPENRRYHAEPVCCGDCGPEYELLDGRGETVNGDAIAMAAEMIDRGKIVAIKGIGGFHLACDAGNEDAAKKLRKRLGRESQPFAIMAKSMDAVRRFAEVGENEMEELKSYRRPIVLLKKRDDFPLPDSLAPDLHTIGVMLPYAPIHYILFHLSKSEVYVMTSGNRPDFPMVKDNNRIQELMGIADYFLIHNRRIVNRIDDSVIRFVASQRAVVRRSRGFVPLPITIPFRYHGIAMGAELMNSFAVIKGNSVYPSQYIGNTYNVETLNFMRDAISRFSALINGHYNLVIVDSHPLYNTSSLGREIAEEESAELLSVQHHVAHIASIMAEQNVDEIVGIAMDGVGYGSDGKAWGGEIITITQNRVRREVHISYFPLPGGDIAAEYPARSLMGLMWSIYGEEAPHIFKSIPHLAESLKFGEREIGIMEAQLKRGLNVTYTSSTGRVLDAFSALLGVCMRRTYEGEPAMKLESVALRGKRDLNFNLPDDMNVGEMIDMALGYMNRGEKTENIAYSVHLGIARAFARRAIEVAESRGIKRIGASGGVAYNHLIMNEIRRIVEKNGLEFLSSTEVPRGDNGISTGQAYLGGMYTDGKIKKEDLR